MDYCRAFLLFSGFALPVFGGGGGLIASSLHTSHGTGHEFLGIYRLWRAFSLAKRSTFLPTQNNVKMCLKLS